MIQQPLPRSAAPLRSKTLLIEGWRGINHSYAVVNQSQILALGTLPGLTLRHRDLPFAVPHWSRETNGAGLPEADQAAIDALPEPRRGEKVDAVYRIASPFRRGTKADRRPTVTFMVTEVGLTEASFADGSLDSATFTRDANRITTPSAWSRDRLIERGFAADKITVIPHGVDRAVFHPLSPEERAAGRAALGLREDETVFLNVGLPAWNKGIDILLTAFALLRASGRKARLILKDQRDLYGHSVEDLIRTVGANHPVLLTDEVLGSISVLSSTMARGELRLLYGVADAYVSPYRAEGFNLPVLEAIACGTPAITTAGGATDAFCTDTVAIRIPGSAGTVGEPGSGVFGRYIEPSLGMLVDAMASFVPGRPAPLPGFAAASAALAGHFTWERAARDLAALTVGLDTGATEPAALPVELRAITQKDVLDFAALMRPLATERTGKVRVGNAYDGGYVLPEVALACERVLSIGVGPDVSFDIALAERGALIAQFDHTVEKPPSDHANCTFYRLGWGSETAGDLLGFNDILQRFDGLGPGRAMLKFDIEGAEYEVMPGLNPEALRRFEVIVCEIHDLDRLTDPVFYHRARRCLEVLTQHHAPVHLHANNYAPVSIVAGVPMPHVLELSFLRRDLDGFPGPSREPIPGPLDRPNHPYRVDICLTAF